MVHKNISFIVAIAENFAIGRNNLLLFHLPDGLKRFYPLTSETIIMGRNTLLLLPMWSLPNRRHIVIFDMHDEYYPGREKVFSVDVAIEKVREEPKAFIIGVGMV